MTRSSAMMRGTLLGLVATLAVVAAFVYVRKAVTRPVGAECAEDADCGSGICLRQAMDDSFNDVLHGRESHHSVCTDRCDGDEDCPGTMACGAVSGNGAIWHGCVWREGT